MSASAPSFAPHVSAQDAVEGPCCSRSTCCQGGHADRVRMSRHGWAIDFGANSFLIGKAIQRCRNVIDQCRDLAASGQTISRSDLEAKLKKTMRRSTTQWTSALARKAAKQYRAPILKQD
jgi:hypothetical protein